MEETMKQIIDLILLWGPSIVSIITMICTVIVAIKKVNNSNSSNLKETQKLRDETHQIMKENAELKKQLNKILNKVYHVKQEK